MMARWSVALVLVSASVLVGCTDFDPDDRRLARQDEYALDAQQCTISDGVVIATGELTNHSGEANGFGVTVRFFDGDVDLGRPQSVDHPEPLADGETWAWEVRLATDGSTVADLRCNVIQVAVGQDVTHNS